MPYTVYWGERARCSIGDGFWNCDSRVSNADGDGESLEKQNHAAGSSDQYRSNITYVVRVDQRSKITKTDRV